MFLGGVINNLSQFLSEYQEVHALVEGFCDGFFPFTKGIISKELQKDIEAEHHYYRGGVVVGAIAAAWFWFGIYAAWRMIT